MVMMCTIDETLKKISNLDMSLRKCLYPVQGKTLACNSFLAFADAATLRFAALSEPKLYTGMIFVYGKEYEKLANQCKLVERVPDSLKRYVEGNKIL